MKKPALGDAIVVLMKWSDGSTACFFQSDKSAIKQYIKQKTLKNSGTKLEYSITKCLKSDYDKLNGF
jgi:hypothetical protein